MPESHLNFRYPKPKRKVRQVAPRSDVRSGGRDYAGGGRGRRVSGYGASQSQQTTGRRYAQIQRSRPGRKPPYRLKGHPEKFISQGEEGHGQVVNYRGSVRKERNVQRMQRERIKQSLLRLLAAHPVGRGLEEASAQVLWEKVQPLLGGKKPNTVYTNKLRRGVAGEARFGQNKEVRLRRDLDVGMLPIVGGRSQRQAASRVLLHEWAHTRQPKQLELVYGKNKGVKAYAEGGAEAFMGGLAPALGLGEAQSSRDYAKYRRWYERRFGRQGVYKGQFKK